MGQKRRKGCQRIGLDSGKIFWWNAKTLESEFEQKVE